MNLAELPDELDRAAAITQAEAEEGIAAAHRACTGPSLSHCQECGEPIPEARQAIGGIRTCIDCANARELYQRTHAR